LKSCFARRDILQVIVFMNKMQHSSTCMTQLKRKKEKDAKYLFVGTAGTACFATSAPFPFSTNTDLPSRNR
jgi:hypothetical protein